MIEFRHDNIFDSEAQTLVNPVNCVGIMGRGLALQFKRTYPENFKIYKLACSQHNVQPGHMLVYETGYRYPKYIVNFPTKRHWRDSSKIEDIVSGMLDLVCVVTEYNIKSIAIPAIGSGLGGLPWRDVKPIIEESAKSMPLCHVIVYEPVDVSWWYNNGS